jgi:hypothetical protein
VTRFEMMSEEEARRIVDYTRRAIAAHLAGGIHSDDPKVRAEARLISLQAETYADRAAAKRRLRSVTDDMGEEEYRAVSAREAGRMALDRANAAKARARVSRREDT